MIVDSSADDIVYSSFFTGVHGNYLKPSIRAADPNLDPDNLPDRDPKNAMNFSSGQSKPKSWKEIWGSGQGIDAVKAGDAGSRPRGATAARIPRRPRAAGPHIQSAGSRVTPPLVSAWMT